MSLKHSYGAMGVLLRSQADLDFVSVGWYYAVPIGKFGPLPGLMQYIYK